MFITEEFVRSLLPKRKTDSHKGSYGKLLLLCGSVGYTGAAVMAAKAAARSGAGLVFVGVPEAIYPIVAAKLDEPMVFPLPCEVGKLSSEAARAILEKLADMDAVLVGPGLGQSRGVRECVMAVLQGSRVPVILDADGINVISRHIDVLRESACPVIVTPHPGEFVRLGGDLSLGREDSAMALAKKLQCICVLKGHHTVVTDGSQCRINPTGNPGMAVGGSGDVLAGVLTAFVGQGLSPLDAASAAVWVHGAAGDICEKEIGQYGMLPTDMIRVLPRLLP